MTASLLLALLAAAADNGGKIEGQVLHAVTGQPVPKAVVTLLAATINRPGASQLTDSNGRFTFTNLPPAFYGLSASKSGFLSGMHGAKNFRRAHSGLSLREDATTSSTPLKTTLWLHPASQLRGQVLDEDGDPLEFARVQAYRGSVRNGELVWSEAASADTNAIGDFYLGGLQPGQYRVSAAANQGRSANVEFAISSSGQDLAYQTTYYPNTTQPNESRVISLRPGQTSEVLQFVLRRVPVFSPRGIFHTASRLPERSYVSVVPHLTTTDDFIRYSSAARSFSIDKQTGAFHLRELPEGTYEVSVIDGLGTQAPVLGHAIIRLPLGASSEFVVPPNTPGQLSGSLVVEDGMPMPNLSIRFRVDASHARPGAFQEASTVNGEFKIANLLPGPYTFEVFGPTNPPVNFYVKSVEWNGQKRDLSRVDVLGGENRMNIVLSPKAASLTAQLETAATLFVLQALAPPPGVRAITIRQSTPTQAMRFPSLAPGTYRLYAFLDDDEQTVTDPDILSQFASQSATITLGESESRTISLKPISSQTVEEALQPR